MKFRLPRKLKKKLRKTLWFFPPMENGNRQVGFPARNGEHYKAYKEGLLTDFWLELKKEKDNDE